MARRKNRSSARRSKPTRAAFSSRSTRRSARPVAARSARSGRTTRPSTRRASNGGRPWSSQELTFLRKFYRTQSTSWVARQLGRTVYSVRYKASDLSIKKANPSVWKNNGANRPTATNFAGATKKAWKATGRRSNTARKARTARTSRTRVARVARRARGRR